MDIYFYILLQTHIVDENEHNLTNKCESVDENGHNLNNKYESVDEKRTQSDE